MPLRWAHSDEFGILTVVGQGDVCRRDIEDYLNATLQEGTRSYAKLVDLTVGNLTLDREDLQSVARMVVEYGVGEAAAGPVAMVVRGALNIDMAVLLKQRVGSRPFRVFTDLREAHVWLMTFRASPAEHMPVRPAAQMASAAR